MQYPAEDDCHRQEGKRGTHEGLVLLASYACLTSACSCGDMGEGWGGGGGRRRRESKGGRHLVDEQDDAAGGGGDLLDDGLQAVLKLPPELGARHKRPQVQRHYHPVLRHTNGMTLGDEEQQSYHQLRYFRLQGAVCSRFSCGSKPNIVKWYS